MKDTFPTSSRTDTERPTTSSTETSPSAGWRETALAFHAPDAHAVDVDPTPSEYLKDMNTTEREPSPPEVAL